MPRFSLIVATKGRVDELQRLLSSLLTQEPADYELIIVDQNADDRLATVISAFPEQCRLRYIRCEPGVSRARNLGIAAATGQILSFPDDDCWYLPDTLHNVDRWFREHPAYGILSVTSRDDNGVRSGNRWAVESCDLSSLNVFRASATYTFFVNRAGKAHDLWFDENIGPGCGNAVLSGEDTDYVLSALDRGVKGRFYAKWYIGHPRKDIIGGFITRERAYGYGFGMGTVEGKHGLLLLVIASAGYDFVRAALVLLLGRRLPASLWLAHGRGAIAGYRAKRAELRASAT